MAGKGERLTGWRRAMRLHWLSRWPLNRLRCAHEIRIAPHSRRTELVPCSDYALFSNTTRTTIPQLDSSGSIRASQMLHMSMYTH
jgi:hypothetical protein